MAKRWQLKPHHRGKRGGVTIALPGSMCGQPDVARVSHTLFNDEIIEGDHWEVFAGRHRHDLLKKALEPAKVDAQSVALAPPPAQSLAQPMVQLQEPSVAPQEPEPELEAHRGLQEPEASVEPVRAREDDGTFRPDDPSTPDVNEAFDPPKVIEPVGATDDGYPAKAESDMGRDYLEAMAVARGVTGPDGEAPADAQNKPTLVAWINGEEPPVQKRRRRRRKTS